MTTKITTTPTPLAVVDTINSIIDDTTNLSTTVGNKLDKTGKAADATKADTATTAGNVTGTVAVANGGTGATTAANALKNLGLTATATELNYCDGVTSNIQTQLNAKTSSPFTARATSIGEASATKPAVAVTTYRSGTSWYRVWSDGWLEQGGIINAGGTVTFLKPFSDTNYTLCASIKGSASTYNINWLNGTPQGRSATGFSSSSSGAGFEWTAYGKGA